MAIELRPGTADAVVARLFPKAAAAVPSDEEHESEVMAALRAAGVELTPEQGVG